MQLTPLHGIEFTTDTANLTQNKLPFLLPVSYCEQKRNMAVPPIWSLNDIGERYRTQVDLFNTTNNSHVLNIACEGSGQFYFHKNGLDICWDNVGTGFSHYLQTFGASLFLELNNIPCVHGNTLEKDGQGILLIAPSRMGKSSLSASLVSQGFSLLTDDMTALYHNAELGFHTYPSWSKLRLWPDSAKAMLQNVPVSSSKKVHSRFSKEEIHLASTSQTHNPVPLNAGFILNRVDKPLNSAVTITPLPASLTTMLLLQNSMLADAYRPLGIEQSRLTQLANCIEHIPFYRLDYPSGFDKIDQVSEMLAGYIKNYV